MGNTTRTRLTLHKLSLAACLSALAGRALAQEDRSTAPSPRRLAPFGGGSQWVIAADGLAEFAYRPEPRRESTVAAADAGAETTTVSEGSTTTFHVLRPAVGVDFFPVDHVSVGLGAEYGELTAHHETRYAGLRALSEGTESDQSLRTLMVKPRVGGAYTWSSGFGVWGRVSAEWATTWGRWETRGGQSVSQRSGGLSGKVQALATYTPAPHFIVMAGPALEKQLATWADPESPDPTDASDIAMAVAASVGAGAYF